MKLEFATKTGRRIAQFNGRTYDERIEPVYQRDAFGCLTFSFSATDEQGRSINLEAPLNELLWSIARACENLSLEVIDTRLKLIAESSVLRPILNQRKREFEATARSEMVHELQEAHKHLAKSESSFFSLCERWGDK